MAAMGSFTEPVLPDVDLDEWASRPYFERLRAMCVDWTVHGFGIPPVAYLFYVVKLAVYVGAFVFIASSPDAAEDDGVVMGFVHDIAERASRLVILDAGTFEAVAAVQIPARIPFGFHGNWVPTGR